MEISNHTEQFIIEALRAAKALAISLVAEVDGRIVGHIAFSPVTMSDGTKDWYGLGPVSVHPDCFMKDLKQMANKADGKKRRFWSLNPKTRKKSK